MTCFTKNECSREGKLQNMRTHTQSGPTRNHESQILVQTLRSVAIFSA